MIFNFVVVDCIQRFQKLYQGYQQSDSADKKQLVALHLQHRQGELNSKKRIELEAYMAELQKSPVKVSTDSKNWRLIIYNANFFFPFGWVIFLNLSPSLSLG